MNSEDKHNDSYDDWKPYELLVDILQHNHTRWIDNYRVFLSFNTILLPAITVLFGYSLNNNNFIHLRPLIPLICLLAAIITFLGIGLLIRISIDSKLRQFETKKMEENFPDMPIHPFGEGYEFFFGKEGENEIEGFPRKK
ncbi:hypothetical protein ACFL50_00070 [Candidatus Latescibacterota bacterium]